MLTIFSTPKPFRGHIGVIQRNALESWKRLHPAIEVILFGDEEGAAETSRELGLRHEPAVRRNEHGTKYLEFIFARAQQIAGHSVLCYVNCDILLPKAFLEAAQRVAAWQSRFLMVGRRWDLNITALVDFAAAGWEQRVLEQAARKGQQRPSQWIDYFVFSRGLFREIPPLVIGRVGWDNWLLWKARSEGAALVDASAVVCAVHQNHDYGYHPEGEKGVWNDAQAQRNYEVAGGPSHLYTMEDATHRLTPSGIVPNHYHVFAPARRAAARLRSRIWFALLGLTRPVRHALGLRQSTLHRAMAKAGLKRES